MIKLTDFLLVDDPKKTKVKFNMNPANPSYPAWDFLRDDDSRWIDMNNYRVKGNSNNDLDKADYLLAFAQYYPYGTNYYIFGGYYKIESKDLSVSNGVAYKLVLQDKYKDYIKRLIIKVEAPVGRNLYLRWYETLNGFTNASLNPEIYELAPSTKIGDFPGYNNVLLSHADLEYIFNQDAPEWKQALSSVKGVYCIIDKSNGQLYIGSASGDNEGIWQRWKSYANIRDLTGGNKTFEEIKNVDSQHIIDNFQYTILEIFDMKTSRDDIIAREERWKKVFQTKKYGMNN